MWSVRRLIFQKPCNSILWHSYYLSISRSFQLNMNMYIVLTFRKGWSCQMINMYIVLDYSARAAIHFMDVFYWKFPIWFGSYSEWWLVVTTQSELFTNMTWICVLYSSLQRVLPFILTLSSNDRFIFIFRPIGLPMYQHSRQHFHSPIDIWHGFLLTSVHRL